MRRALLFTSTALAIAACHPDGLEDDAQIGAAVRGNAGGNAGSNTTAPTAIVPAARLNRFLAALPDVAWARLQDILQSPLTLWYDKEAMIPSYQDSVGDGSYTPIGARANNAGRPIIVQQGRRLFTADGEHWSFPFSVTAGTDDVPNRVVINFLSLPEDAGELLPVVYRTIDDNSALGGLGLHKWTWMFPKGTVVGEIMFIEDGASDIYPVEIRTRTRYLSGWATNAFRPFPTAQNLADAIKAKRPSWQSQSTLQTVVSHLEDSSTLQPRTLRSPAFNDIVTLEGHEDVIPNIGDDALVRELLTTTPFRAAYGLTWKNNGRQSTFAGTTLERFSVVPSNSTVGLLEVRESFCVTCHQDAGRSINDFEPAAILYGDIWGEDRIFSFHPWDQDRYRIFNNENRQVRPEFASDGLVVRYNPSLHAADQYDWLQSP